MFYYYKNFCKIFSKHIKNTISENTLLMLIIGDDLNFSSRFYSDTVNKGKTYIVGLSVME